MKRKKSIKLDIWRWFSSSRTAGGGKSTPLVQSESMLQEDLSIQVASDVLELLWGKWVDCAWKLWQELVSAVLRERAKVSACGGKVGQTLLGCAHQPCAEALLG